LVVLTKTQSSKLMLAIITIGEISLCLLAGITGWYLQGKFDKLKTKIK
jgi:hypothetical protein